MKKIILTLLIIAQFTFLAKAQLPDGSIVPDFSMEDINGNEYNLYELLDQGKTVFVDFSATWCIGCWSFHEEGYYEEMWDKYGPDGSDEMYVFLIESDESTDFSDLQGTGNNTLGDWITDTNFPIVDDHTIASIFGITGYPTIFAICPNRTIKEVDYLEDFWYGVDDAYEKYVTTCESATNELDAAIIAYDGYSSNFCGELNFEPVFTFQNKGINPITSATIELLKNGESVQEMNFDGSLNTYYTETFIFDEQNITEGTTYKAIIKNINGTSSDDDVTNDEMEVVIEGTENYTIETNKIVVKVITDGFAAANYWVIRDLDGNVFYERGNPAIGAAGGGTQNSDNFSLDLETDTEYQDAVTLPGDGCYEFAIYDEMGDGMYTNFGYYSEYLVVANTGQIIVYNETAEFLKSHIVQFKVENVIMNSNEFELDLGNFSVSPNPVVNNMTINFALDQKADVNFEIYDILGAKLQNYSDSYSTGSQTKQINTEDLAAGTYFLKAASNGKSKSIKFVKYE